jgi:uncharacterized protein YqjF (DUF2071 family)
MTAVVAPPPLPHKAGDVIAGPLPVDVIADASNEAPCPEAFAWPVRRPLLWAEWRNLVLLNFEIDPHILEPYVPHGTELDYWQDKTYASIVGFQFLNARLFGIRIPFHAGFEEVNLRFYVRRRAREGWRRGVVFIREIAPRWCVAVTARLLYGENYLCVPMTHQVIAGGADEAPDRIEYRWRLRGQDRHVALEPAGPPQLPTPGSLEEFIIEHYWGYSKLPGDRTNEYCVAHRPWHISPAASIEFNCDVTALYGPQFAPFLEAPPASAFWADGSPVRVYPGHRLDSHSWMLDAR